MGRSRARSTSQRRRDKKEKKSKEKKRRRDPSEERIEEILATLSQAQSSNSLLSAIPPGAPYIVPSSGRPLAPGMTPGSSHALPHVPSNIHTMMSASPYVTQFPAPSRVLNTSISASGIDWSCRIYVGSIHFEANESIVREVFEQYVGPVKSLSLQPDTLTGHHRGYCFVEFPTPDFVAKALNLPEGVVHIMGRPVKIGRPAQANSSHTYPTAIQDIVNPYHAQRGVAYPSVHMGNVYSPQQPNMPIHMNYSGTALQNRAMEAQSDVRDPSHVVVLTYFILTIHENIADIFQQYIIPEVVKYGPILKLILYNETTQLNHQQGPLPRVLIQYEDLNHAMNCQEALDRKVFGQRCIRAQFLPDSHFQTKIAPVLQLSKK